MSFSDCSSQGYLAVLEGDKQGDKRLQENGSAPTN
jgi:hypothetical protein